MRQKESLYLIQGFISWENGIDIFLGDFNINVLEASTYVSEFLFQCKMVVTWATHTLGSFLDHVYILKKHLLANQDRKYNQKCLF